MGESNDPKQDFDEYMRRHRMLVEAVFGPPKKSPDWFVLVLLVGLAASVFTAGYVAGRLHRSHVPLTESTR